MSEKPINYASAAFQESLKRNKGRLILIGVILVAVIVLLSQSLFVVGEAEQSVVSRFGVITRIILNQENDFHSRYAELLQNEITSNGNVKISIGSGLHFKVPFVDKVETFSSRLYTYVSDSEVVNTAEKKQYYVQTFAQWYIADPALFSLKLGNMVSAENQLDNLIHPVIVQAINRLTAEDFVSNKDALNAALAKGLQTVNEDMATRGIEVKDIQVHRTILPPQISKAPMPACRPTAQKLLNSCAVKVMRLIERLLPPPTWKPLRLKPTASARLAKYGHRRRLTLWGFMPKPTGLMRNSTVTGVLCRLCRIH